MDLPAISDALNALSRQAVHHFGALETNSIPVTADMTSPPTLPALPASGLGTANTYVHLQSTILPHLAQGHAGPRYYGFVTGGVTPAALLADYLVSTYDQNVQVHLPQSISTHVERHTITMLTDLLSLRGYNGTITTGATAANILGIACAREHIVYKLTGKKVSSTGGGKVCVLCAGAHSSISKACSILGVGRDNCIDLTCQHPASFNLERLQHHLERNKNARIASIVVATFGEVNTATFTHDIPTIQNLCLQFNAWLHVDAAFGILARIHPDKKHLVTGLEKVDSISFDGHKFFNVPYDCGVFLTTHMDILSQVCGNTGAAYLSAGTEGYSPLNISLENSRRFRALPLYASLLSLGREGYVALVQRCCSFAAALGDCIESSKIFRLLEEVEFNVVLFQARGYEEVVQNDKVKDSINRTGKVYISGTQWGEQGALRIAVCNHLTPSNVHDEATKILTILENAILQ